MADEKLSALTELAATPAQNDEVYIRDISEAAAQESKRITIANLLAGLTDVSDADAAVGEVKDGKFFYSVASPKKEGTMPTVALAAGANSYPTGYHAGEASLTAVDADLTAGNIADGVTIFGVLGTHAGGALVQDTSVEAEGTDTLGSSGGGNHSNSIAGSGGEETIVTTTPTFAADSLAFIGATVAAGVNNTDCKMRLYVDGVQKEEYTFADTQGENVIMTRFDALSGTIVIHCTAYNYNVLAKTFNSYGPPNKTVGIFLVVGSVKAS